MDREQEKKLLDHVKHFMHRYDRPEKLVIFDGKLSVQEQIDLFFSASVVIGPHGGGLANLLFTRPGATCADRPKVLEFVTTRATSELQGGGSQFTYYYFFGSMPWVELHNVFYTKVAEGEITFINEGSFYDAMYAIFSPEPTPGRGGLRAIAFEQK
jgi:Glycosyltransferase 61